MKRLAILLCLWINIQGANAQFSQDHAIYMTNGLNLGNYFGISFDLNYNYQDSYAFKLGYTGNVRRPKSQPDNFTGGVAGPFTFDLDGPYDHFNSFYVSVGKIYPINLKRTLRLNASIGLAYTRIREPENWQFIDNTFLIDNYLWNYKTSNTISLIINPKIEFALTRLYGFTISPMIQINPTRIYAGIRFGQMVGLLRRSNRT